MVAYRNGAMKACGADAVQDFEEHKENVAYWFKVVAHHYFAILLSKLTCN
jgi:hypothetical protein